MYNLNCFFLYVPFTSVYVSNIYVTLIQFSVILYGFLLYSPRLGLMKWVLPTGESHCYKYANNVDFCLKNCGLIIFPSSVLSLSILIFLCKILFLNHLSHMIVYYLFSQGFSIEVWLLGLYYLFSFFSLSDFLSIVSIIIILFSICMDNPWVILYLYYVKHTLVFAFNSTYFLLNF